MNLNGQTVDKVTVDSFLKSDRISVAEAYFINPKIVDVSAIYYAKNDIIIEGLWRISQWL